MNTIPLLREQLRLGLEWRGIPPGDAGMTIRNPATGEPLGRVPTCSAGDVTEAIEAARTALPGWRGTTAARRAAALRRLANLIRQNQPDLARLLTLEQGKPLREAELEVGYGLAYVEWYAEEALRIYGETIPGPAPHRRTLVLREPIGVCAAITPWNFPLATVARKMAPALAAGCTFICKPAPETPFSALALAALAEEAGIPPGVVNVLTGDAALIAGVLMDSPVVRQVSFTGSTEVGQILIRHSAETIKKLTLELGGNAPLIVFDDADVNAAVEGALFAKYRNAGQTCIGANRLLLHESIAPEFIPHFIERSRALKVGSGLDPEVDLGPLISPAASAKVRELLQEALERGAHLALGDVPAEGSRFCSPVVVTGVSPSMRLWSEEIFGPVTPIVTFGDEAEAIRIANDTPYGLASYLYTRDLGRAFRATEALEFGMVGVNSTAISDAHAPFGGIKKSGFGREGGRAGIEEYLNLKYVSLDIGGESGAPPAGSRHP